MAPKTTNSLVRCESCGEDYSATYRRCPFCGNSKDTRKEAGRRDDYEMAGVSVTDEEGKENMKDSGHESSSASRGGKRLAGASTAGNGEGSASGRTQQTRSASASGARSGASRSGAAPGSARSGSPVSSRSMNGSGTSRSRAPQPKSAAFWDFCDRIGVSPVRVIGFLLTLALIVAAFLIVTKVVIPMIGRGSVDTPNNEKPGTSQTGNPGSSGTVLPSPSLPSGSASPTPTGSGTNIPADQTATSFTIDKTEFAISDRWPDPVTIKATLIPAGSTGKITWTSSDESVAIVDENGKVTGLKKGNATITASLPGGVTHTCKVYVTLSKSVTTGGGTSAGDGIFLSHSEFSISKQWPDPVPLKVYGATGAVTWTSSNNNVATVNQNGKVTGVGNGKCTIKVTDSTGKTAQCTVYCSIK